MTASGQSAGPLAGVRVVEMGQLLAGPFCGQLLGDLGADVVKIEDPAKGDPLRQWGRQLPQGQSLWWSVVGRNKRSVTLNLRDPEGQELARQLIAGADVLVENFRPGTMERWGLGFAELQELNPGLVMVRVSGFGQDGPYSQRAGYGAIGEAMGGLRYVVGDPSTPPSRVGISIGDTLAALFATIGALAALQERQTSGRGQIVDSAIYEAVLGVMESLVPEWQVTGYQRERTGAVLPNVAPSNVYPTQDGQWLLIAANQDTVFARLAKAMDAPELADDPRYASHGARGERQEELDNRIAAFTSALDAEKLEALLEEHGVPSGRIFRPVDMFADPQFQARESITEVDHPVLGPVAMQNVFPRLSRTRGTVRWPGPELGAHTAEVLAGIGVDPDALAQLRASGVA
ncbi:CoA transferase [Arthrobacter zhangbolii]|uniref:CoA transferase n=1 Tax=Arthrobacter zhangbolii TaxID=2886936 RepID=A0A9X1M8S3_9MICC|nr:CoA transferase [Arthrobacter zhangbolii]MCC3273489.1 CoA transferase [Arthrobacter zhangbolii]MCC3295548.1 CoA transferase [Arthrobacter zhangbolii]UON92302.1 CoA transferase [Arthrobacter zhangbolii]